LTDQLRCNWVPSVKKGFETLCHLSEIGRRRETGATPMRLAYALFEADLRGIRLYGRPVYGEHWRSGWMGPCPEVMTGLLAGDPFMLGMLSPQDAAMLAAHTRPIELRKADPRELSATDMEVLEHGMETIDGLDDLQAMRGYSTHRMVLEARGGVIWPIDMTDNEMDEEHVRDIEGSMPYILF